MASEYWIVVDSADDAVEQVPATDPGTAQSLAADYDADDDPTEAPNRVVHLVEAAGDYCWHCGVALVERGRPHCHKCPPDVDCDVDGCQEPGCRTEVEDGK